MSGLPAHVVHNPRLGTWITVAGPVVALTNEHAGSDGDIFSHTFKLMKIGPLVGTRTWGGVVGITSWGPLIDGGSVSVPEFAAIVNLDGKYAVEGHGVEPDIVVNEDVSQQLAGKDPQLDKAIEVLQKAIQAYPLNLPPQPPGLDKAPPNMRPKSAASTAPAG